MQKTRFLPLSLPMALLAVATLPVHAADLRTDLEACRALHSDAERLGCYDTLAEPRIPDATPLPAASPVLPAASPAPKAASPVPKTAAQPAARAEASASTEEAFGLGAGEIMESQAKAAGEVEMREMRAHVSQIFTIRPDRVKLVLDNGQVWRQIDSSRLKPKVGDDIVIQKAAFGSFKMKKVGSSRSMRVNRVE